MNKFWLAGMRAGAIVWATGRAIWPYVKLAFLITLGILAIPPIERYWVPRMATIPTVPLSGVILMFVSAVFMASAAALFYVFGLLIVQIVRIERRARPHLASIAVGLPANAAVAPAAPTGGSFIPNDDEALFLREQLDLLKKKGFLTDTDSMDLETVAKELGFKMIQEKRGRTE